MSRTQHAQDDLARNDTRNSIEEEKANAGDQKQGKDLMGNELDQARTPLAVFKFIFNWYPARMSKLERRLVLKMDFAILTFGVMAFFLKYLDSSNIKNAYVSGMKNDLDLQQNEYAWFGFYYYMGYSLLQVPSLLIVSRPGYARWFLPGVELVWGSVTFALTSVKKAEHIYVIRFLLGALATPSYTGVNYVLGSWYRGDELFKRSAVFMIGNSLGQMFSGYLQAAALGIDGAMGLAGWRWLFIIDGCITVPIALISFMTFPGLPEAKKIWWMTEEEHELAKKRVRDDGIAKSRPLSFKIFKEVFSSWHIYLCVAMITVFLQETYPAGEMTLWLKSLTNPDGSQRWSQEFINIIPTAVFAIIAITTFLTGSLAGLYNIWYMMLVIQGICLFAVINLRIWNIPDNLKWASYFLLGFMGAPNPLFFGWINRLCKRNAEERAIIMGSVFMIGWAFFAWVPLVAYKTVEAPRWTIGYSVSMSCLLVSTSLFCLGGYLHKREEANRARLGLDDQDLADAPNDEDRQSNYGDEIKEKDQGFQVEHIEHFAPVVDTSHFTNDDRAREGKNSVIPNATAI